jgi:hypothetical protein
MKPKRPKRDSHIRLKSPGGRIICILKFYFIEEVVVGHERSIGFKVKNTGSATKIYSVSITDDHGFTLPPTRQQYTINAGESANETFIVKPNTSSVIL